jgi:hypothetical protein
VIRRRVGDGGDRLARCPVGHDRSPSRMAGSLSR